MQEQAAGERERGLKKKEGWGWNRPFLKSVNKPPRCFFTYGLEEIRRNGRGWGGGHSGFTRFTLIFLLGLVSVGARIFAILTSGKKKPTLASLPVTWSKPLLPSNVTSYQRTTAPCGCYVTQTIITPIDRHVAVATTPFWLLYGGPLLGEVRACATTVLCNPWCDERAIWHQLWTRDTKVNVLKHFQEFAFNWNSVRSFLKGKRKKFIFLPGINDLFLLVLSNIWDRKSQKKYYFAPKTTKYSTEIEICKKSCISSIFVDKNWLIR